MASVRELKTVWQIRYRDRSRDPSETSDSLSKAEYTKTEAQEEATWRQQLYTRDKYDPWSQDEPGASAVAGQLTVKSAVEKYVQKKREAGQRGESGGWTEKTYRSDAPVLRQFYRHVGASTLIERLRPEHLRSWVYQERLAEVTKYTRWIKLCAMLRWWEDRGWISELPRLPGRPQTRRRIRTTIGPAQLETICEAYEHLCTQKIEKNKHTTVAGVDWHPDAWRVAFYQGFRRSELLELRVRNVLLDEGMIQVGDRDFQQKGKRESLIPLVNPVEEILKPYLEEREPEERIFGTPSTNTRVSDHFREATDHAGLEHEEFPDLSAEDVPFEPLEGDVSQINLYTLRHSCCTYWLRQRRRLIWVNHLMRHKEIETTMEYVHLLPTHLREMYRGIGEE